MEQFKKKFLDEAADLILDLERSLLQLGSDMKNKSLIETVFRAMHSLKGGSAMFGFMIIDEFTHLLEAMYDAVRAEKLPLTQEMLDVTLHAVDHLKILFVEDDKLSEATAVQHKQLMARIESLIKQTPVETKNAAPINAKKDVVIATAQPTFYVMFKPFADIFKNGTNPLLIVDELTHLGNSKTFMFSDVPELPYIDVAMCYTHWVVLLSGNITEESIRDVFIFVDMDCDLVIKQIANVDLIANQSFINSMNEAYLQGHNLDLAFVESLIPVQIKQPIVNENKETTIVQENATVNNNKTKELSISSIRVASDKLDELINLVSELVTTQASLSLLAEKIGQKELLVVAEDIEKISRRLRDNTFGIRLIPIENMVTRFQRLVRELSQELGKDVAFFTEGTETELDKTIIESLMDPLLHIIRNSIDHGIEMPDVRIKKGKAAQGKILFKAFYSGSNVYIQVIDDGAGIDEKKIKQLAIERGLISSDAVLSSKEILELIFLPGFSTAENVTKVSGRGVGMDVVKRKISDIRGEVSIETKLNAGTTITIKLPLTLSIIDGLLVVIDGVHYVIPLATVDKCFEFKHDYLMNAVNNMIFVNDGHIPYIYLRKEFGATSAPPANEQVVVVEYGDMRFGLAVDYVVGEYQAVLKSLGRIFKKQEIISGATILGDGTVALVVDSNKIIQQVTNSN